MSRRRRFKTCREHPIVCMTSCGRSTVPPSPAVIVLVRSPSIARTAWQGVGLARRPRPRSTHIVIGIPGPARATSRHRAPTLVGPDGILSMALTVGAVYARHL